MAVNLSGTPTTANSPGGVASFSIDAPTNLPTGDLMVLVINTQTAGADVTTPTGWVEQYDTGASGPANCRLHVYTRFKEAGDTSWTVGFTGGSTQFGAVCVGFSGADVSTPLSAFVHTPDSTNNTTLDYGELTTSVADSLALLIGGINSNSTTFTGLPTGYTVAAETGGKRVALLTADATTPGTKPAGSLTTSGSVQGNTLHVELQASPSNLLPVADAGDDQTVEPFVTVTLDGSASSDADGSIVDYSWTQQSGPAVTLSGTGATRTFTAPGDVNQQDYVFRLVVQDDQGAYSSGDECTVTVLPATEFVLKGGTWTAFETTFL